MGKDPRHKAAEGKYNSKDVERRETGARTGTCFAVRPLLPLPLSFIAAERPTILC